MTIWLLLLIPVAAIIVLAMYFNRSMAWWEYLVMLGVPTLVILISKFTVEKVATADREFWNSYVTYVDYTESWSTWDRETCTRQVCTGTGDDRKCHTESYDCSHCDEYPPSWVATDNLGRSHQMDPAMFEELCRRWGNKTFVDKHRSINYHGYCGKDGDAFRTVFDNTFDHTQPVCVVHLYENRVQASHSVFKFQEVTKEDVAKYGLYDYDYSANKYFYSPLIGSWDQAAAKRLSWWNAKLGAPKKVHMLILVFKDQPQVAGDLQESYWNGGNKNEFVLCIGVDGKRQVQWTKVFSWTEVDRLKIEMERKARLMFDDGRPLDLTSVVDTMAVMVQKQFVKKSFEDFKYLTVEPSSTALILVTIIVLASTIGLGVFCVKNDFDLDNPEIRQRWRRW